MPRFIAASFLLCWLLVIGGMVSNYIPGLYFLTFLALEEWAGKVGSRVGLTFMAPAMAVLVLALAIPFALLLLVGLPIGAVVVWLQHRRPLAQRRRLLLRRALVTGSVANFAVVVLGGSYATLLLVAGPALGWTMPEAAVTLAVLVVVSAAAFTSGVRAWRYFRSLR